MKNFRWLVALLPMLNSCGGGGVDNSFRVPTDGSYRLDYEAFSSVGEKESYGTGTGNFSVGGEVGVAADPFGYDSEDGFLQFSTRVTSEDHMHIFEIGARDPGPYKAVGYLTRQPDGTYTGDFEDLFLPIVYKIKLTPEQDD